MPKKRPGNMNIAESKGEESSNFIENPFGSQARHNAASLNRI